MPTDNCKLSPTVTFNTWKSHDDRPQMSLTTLRHSLKITYVHKKYFSNLPEANQLNHWQSIVI